MIVAVAATTVDVRSLHDRMPLTPIAHCTCVEGGIVESLHSLPPEVFSLIARYLSAEDKRNTRLTSKAARAWIDVVLRLPARCRLSQCLRTEPSLCLCQFCLLRGFRRLALRAVAKQFALAASTSSNASGGFSMLRCSSRHAQHSWSIAYWFASLLPSPVSHVDRNLRFVRVPERVKAASAFMRRASFMRHARSLPCAMPGKSLIICRYFSITVGTCFF
jgi:hypothetical protein